VKTGVAPPALPAELDRPSIPEIPTEDVAACPLCGEERWERLAEGYDYELATCRNRWRFVRCLACDHAWLHPRPALRALGVIYPPHYYAYQYAQQVHPLAARAKAWLDRGKIRRILRQGGGLPRGYLDVGCGDGRFLRALEALGVPRERLFGLELDPGVVGRLRREGYRADCARVEDATLVEPASLDLITMFHVIEHVDRPVAIVRKLAEWLAPGGVLAVETPNRRSLDARLFRRTYWGGYHFPRHWHLFTTEGVVRLLGDIGLEPAGVAYQTGHSFWLYSLHHLLRYGRPRLPRVARRFDPMGHLVPLALVTGWDKLRAVLHFRTSAVLVLGRKPAGTRGTGVAISATAP
jgi:SAM-dependent methyltransferase